MPAIIRTSEYNSGMIGMTGAREILCPLLKEAVIRREHDFARLRFVWATGQGSFAGGTAGTDKSRSEPSDPMRTAERSNIHVRFP
jgi:hypothetical protein